MGPLTIANQDTTNNCPYKDLNLSTVDNGYKVTYHEISPKIGASSYDHMNHKYMEFVFEEKDFKGATTKYKEVSDCIIKYNKNA